MSHQRYLGKRNKAAMFQQLRRANFANSTKDYLTYMIQRFTQFQVKSL